MGTLFYFKSQPERFSIINAGWQVYHRTHIARKEESFTCELQFMGAPTHMPLKSRTELKIGLFTVPTEQRPRFSAQFFLAQIKSCPRVYAI